MSANKPNLEWRARALAEGDTLLQLFAAAVDAVLPDNVIAQYLPPPPAGRTIVVGAGKASAAMARALEVAWQGPLEGLVITRYGHGAPCQQIEIVEASHPVPDQAGVDASRRILELVGGLSADDLVIALISGGGSALMALPAPGLSLRDKQAATTQLLASGASISEMNCLRKHLSAIKGGRLAQAAHPATLYALLISDIPGDDLSMIASGPTMADATTLEYTRRIVSNYDLTLPESVQVLLRDPANETLKPGDPLFEGVTNRLIASAQISLEAAARHARELGLCAHILSDRIEGEARDVAAKHAELALRTARGDGPCPCPCVLLSGGETTVTLAKPGATPGRGGRNSEFALALAHGLDGSTGISAIACDTDGIDGTENNAGARITPDTLARAEGLGLDPLVFLDAHDSYSFFDALGDLVVTGATLTNVNDFRAILIE